MDYQNFYDKTNDTRVQVSSFEKTGGISEYMIMLHLDDRQETYPLQLQHLSASFNHLMSTKFQGAVPVFKRFFLSDAANQADLLLEALGKEPGCAVSIIEQAPLDGSKIALWAYLQTGVSVKAFPDGMYAVCGGELTHYWTGTATVLADNSEEQMRLLLNRYVAQLEAAGCTMEANAIRTWIFVQNVDVNYAGIVKARNEVFAEQGLHTGTHFITSTGIQGRGADPRTLVQLSTYSIKGIDKSRIQYLYAPTHLSPTALYGVSFERGVCIHQADRRHVFISGTASIDHTGKVLFDGDICKQTGRMWENVEKLLEEATCSFGDVAMMIVYLRDLSDYETVRQLHEERFPEVPKVFVLAPVCRPKWLIEMECIAFK